MISLTVLWIGLGAPAILLADHLQALAEFQRRGMTAVVNLRPPRGRAIGIGPNRLAELLDRPLKLIYADKG